MLFFAVLFGGIPGRAEKNEPKMPDALDVGPEAVNVAAWGGESDRGPARGGGDLGCRVVGVQIFSFSESGHR
jgi:hypothetical protein